MVAIRNRNTNVPHVFRYPQWAPDVFYPAASLVAYPESGVIDSDDSYWNFYTSLRDIDAGEGPPTQNMDWSLVFNAQAQSQDSEILEKVAAIERQLDSDIARTVHDFLSNDSEFSDIIVSVITDYLGNDSDHDSEMLDIRHDFRSADSDLLMNISNSTWDYGSF